MLELLKEDHLAWYAQGRSSCMVRQASGHRESNSFAISVQRLDYMVEKNPILRRIYVGGHSVGATSSNDFVASSKIRK